MSDEQSKPQEISRHYEKLAHEKGKIVVGLTESPLGDPCVGMTYNGQEY